MSASKISDMPTGWIRGQTARDGRTFSRFLETEI
jgi:hypothetical protein